MLLYEIPNKSYIKTEDGSVFFFDHIDGMYSYCLDCDKNVVHLSASTEVVHAYMNCCNKEDENSS